MNSGEPLPFLLKIDLNSQKFGVILVRPMLLPPHTWNLILD